MLKQMESSFYSNFTCPYRNCNAVFHDVMIFKLHLNYCRTNHACEMFIHYFSGTYAISKADFEDRLNRFCDDEQELEKLIDYIHNSIADIIEKLRSQRHDLIQQKANMDKNDDDDQVVPSVDEGQETWII